MDLAYTYFSNVTEGYETIATYMLMHPYKYICTYIKFNGFWVIH